MSPATIRTSTFTHRRTHRHTHIQAHTSTLKHTTTDTHIRSHCSMSLTAIRTLNIQSLNCHLAPCTMTAATRSQSFEFWYKSHREHAHIILLYLGLARTVYIYTVYDRICGNFLPNIPYIQRIYRVLANLIHCTFKHQRETWGTDMAASLGPTKGKHYHHIIITTALSPQHSLWGLMEALQALEGNHKSCQSACQCACVRAMEQKKPRLLGPAVFRKQNWTQEEQRANSKHTKPQLSGPACTKKSRFVHRRGKGQAHSQMSVVVCLSLNRSSAECTRITCAHEKCL
jgi:hypothetical protein